MIEYVLKKPYTVEGLGTLREGDSITFFNNIMQYDGYAVAPAYYKYIRPLLEDENLKKEYITERILPENKV